MFQIFKMPSSVFVWRMAISIVVVIWLLSHLYIYLVIWVAVRKSSYLALHTQHLQARHAV